MDPPNQEGQNKVMKKILVWKEPSKDVEQNKLAQTAMHSELVQQSQEKLMRSSTDVYISRSQLWPFLALSDL